MQTLLVSNISDFVAMNPHETVRLCDKWFNRDYILITDQLKDTKELAFSFLNSVLQTHEHAIIAEFENARSLNQTLSAKTKALLLQIVEVFCYKRGRESSLTIVDLVGKSYFPIEESLTICEQNGAIEACAVLYKRKGLYSKSIKLYMSAIVKLSVEKLIHTIFVEKNYSFMDPFCTNEHMMTFDHLVL